MSSLTESLASLAKAASMLPVDSAAYEELEAEHLLEVTSVFAAVRRTIEASAAAAAGEVARRSAVSIGSDGLAQRSGFRTPEKLLQHVTGVSSREAGRLVRIGGMMRDVEIASGIVEPAPDALGHFPRQWLTPVGQAVAEGKLSLDAAESIRIGLGEPTGGPDSHPDAAGVTASALRRAAEVLVQLASTLNADQMLSEARMMRDELDAAGIAEREAIRHAQRSFKRYRRPDGMTSYSLLADPENAAFLDDVYDQLTSPRRGAVRMVDADDRAHAQTISRDPRSHEQLAFDGLLAVLRIGADTDQSSAGTAVLGTRRPAMRVLVTERTLRGRATQKHREREAHNQSGPLGKANQDDSAASASGPGPGPGPGPGEAYFGRIEGQNYPVSIETVERITCETGIVPIAFDDDGQCVNVGREHRLFTTRQRLGLAARDGGCRWPECERPPSWSEAHHIDQWKRDGGRTDLADGILLCRHHHLLLHNNRWEITRTGANYWLIPPTSEDPHQTPQPMPHKSAALRDLQSEAG
ncbi:uncharacterized protein DUF222 [Homoserinimonas aerilata]|uniref:Uncharacterized protein DUF222 n=1 Tax=Homoserinimonas aerilata TaxID=1162970 RepID=A0A542YL32_9MICO|nr:DUF222 domain-containing protein [Homoserinimonas aerilata]TQL48634.1 uncharacterized protein DUF222 [Homoserinimonas aerilata]